MKSWIETLFSSIRAHVRQQYSFTLLRSCVRNSTLPECQADSRTTILETLDALQAGLCHLLLRRYPVPSDSFDTFRVEPGLRLVRGLVLEPDISLLRHQDTRQVNFLELEFHRRRVHRRDSVRDVVPDAERLLLRLALQVYEQRVRVAVHDARAPFLLAMDDADGLEGAGISGVHATSGAA